MSQGLTWIAGRRTPLLALVALFALTVGMFAVFQSAQADEHEHLTVTFGDSDNIIGDNQEITVSLTMNNLPTGATYTVVWVAIPGSFPVTTADNAVDTFTPVPGVDTSARNSLNTFFIPKGTEGEFSVTARVTRPALTGEDGVQTFTESGTFTVGDAGVNVASAEISLGKIGHAPATARAIKNDGAATGAHGGSEPGRYEACADDPAVENDAVTLVNTVEVLDDTINATCIALTVTALNSLGKASNGPSITGIHVFAPLATIVYDSEDSDADNNDAIVDNDTEDGSQELPGGSATAKFFVTSENAGTVNVTAIVLGKKGSASSQAFTLTFTGTATSITLGDPSSPLSSTGTAYVAPKDAIEAAPDAEPAVEAAAEVKEAAGIGVANIEVNATDDAGNPAALGELDVEIADADGNDVSTTLSDNQRPKAGTLTRIIEVIGAKAAPGSYTVTVTLGDDEQTTEIVVAGKVATVEAEVSESTVAVGDIITVTATVTDADGNLQPDAGTVMFQAVGSLKLTGLGAAGTAAGRADGTLDDGVATARFVVVDGSGTATIIASVGDVDGVIAVSSDAAAVVDEPDPEPVDGLSQTELNNFASWSGDGTVSGSELLAGIAGATGLLFYDGDSWQRYGADNGQVIPGSRDFTIRSGQTIWISG
jgi:hypothetical protein